MFSVSFDRLYQTAIPHGLSAEDHAAYATRIADDIARLHQREQGFYTTIDDEQLLDDVLAFEMSVRGTYRHIVVLGIGGSTLGTICLQESLTHLFQHELSSQETPSLHVLDNIDPMLLREILDVIDLSKTLFLVVTKSGGTPETLAEYMFVRAFLDQAKLSAKKHLVFITDPEEGVLRSIGKEESIPMFPVPKNVGGRFSVQTAVGLLPAALIGIDIRQLIAGMQDMRDRMLTETFEENVPFQLAAAQHAMAMNGKSMHVLMPYAQKLRSLADWYRQLLAESIGKRMNDDGEVVHVGITPINALGATDQHSQSQLYVEGPHDKFFMFLKVSDHGKSLPIPLLINNEKTAFLDGVDFEQLLHTELEATADAYLKHDRPSIMIEIQQIDAFHLGQLFMLFEGATAFLGELFGINAFDQPGVELSKQLTKQYLLER
jgi:glucose-6-phosphate isomerase